nr:LacI family DNA-binding transcriptional regulator [Streptococcus equi]
MSHARREFSVATVSYVINNREDQKISPETRNKVLQMINLLNYRQTKPQNSLVTQKRQLIALYYKEHSSVLKEQSSFTLSPSYLPFFTQALIT